MTNCASCRARLWGFHDLANAGIARNRSSEAESWARAACSNDFACFLSCSRLARSGSCFVIATSMLKPEVRNQAARDLMTCNQLFMDSGLSPSRTCVRLEHTDVG